MGWRGCEMTETGTGRARFALWAALYALAITYSSVLSVAGLRYVAMDFAAAWQRFLATSYMRNGSDQRADWVANLLMLVPLGFLVAGAMWARRRWLRLPALLGAVAIGVLFVLAVKFLQLFFPPRTVSLGVGAGVAGFAVFRQWSSRIDWRHLAGAASLRLLLDIAVVALAGFVLVPFDIVLSAEDLASRYPAFVESLGWWRPGEGKPWPVQMLLLLAGMFAFAPLGMRLALPAGRGLAGVWLRGVGWLLALYAASLVMLGTEPHLIAVGYRSVGVLAGGWLLRWLRVGDLDGARRRLARCAPWLVVPYLLALAAANEVAHGPWLGLPEALAALDPREALLFWHHYMVSKAQAVRSVAVHMAMYAPVGALLWARRSQRGDGRITWIAATLAGGLALAVELARGMKPELHPDFSEVLIAAAAAAGTVRLLPWLWGRLGALREPEPSPAVSSPAVPALAPIAGRGGLWRWLALPCAAGVVWLLGIYPLGPGVLGLPLLAYALLLWRWPAAWLVLLPPVLVGFDLSPWTGWIMLGEPDAFILATLAVLLWRVPPRRRDLWPTGWGGRALALFALLLGLALARGLTAGFDVPDGTANPYLMPENALRLAKGFVGVLALMPWLRARRADEAAALLGAGMLAALAVVAALVFAERCVFGSPGDFSSDYRVVASFSSMHVGGGHIGAFLALALPFLALCLTRRGWPLLAPLAAGGLYALLVCFARTAYAASALGFVVLAAGWVLAAARRRRAVAASALAGAVMLAALGGALAVGAGSVYMAGRFAAISPDFALRARNWSGGLALADRSPAAVLLGMGLGTYPRIALARQAAMGVPGDFALGEEAGAPFLTTRFGGDFYFEQKLLRPGRGPYMLTLSLRGHDPAATLGVALCTKLLLYSQDCVDGSLPVGASGDWRHASLTLDIATPSRWRMASPLRDLAFFTADGVALDIADVRLTDANGRNLLENGDFRRGTTRWMFSSDRHLPWRMKDLALMIWFETGALGLAAFALLLVLVLASAARAVWRGEAWAAPVLAGLAAFLACGLFDATLEAPRLAALFWLVALCALEFSPRHAR